MRPDSGFSLLEILIAAMIFTVGVIVIAGLFYNVLTGSSDAENTSVAINLCQRRIEEYRNLDFDAGVVSEARADVTDFTQFEREVVVTEPETDLKLVTITTYWSFRGDDVSASLSTYISRN